MNNANSAVNQLQQPISGKPPLEQAILMLDSEVGRLSNGLTELCLRLEPILGQIPEKNTKAPIPPNPGNSLVVEKLCQITINLESMSAILATVRARLEV